MPNKRDHNSQKSHLVLSSGMKIAEISPSQREERWNALSHGLGFLVALAVLPVLIVQCAIHGGAAHVVGGTIFGTSMLLALGASALGAALSRLRSSPLLTSASPTSVLAFGMTP